MRSFPVLGSLVLTACFDGDAALHQPCRTEAQCGVQQRCTDGFCGGRPACKPQPTTCDPSKVVLVRELGSSVRSDPSVGFTGAALAGQFSGDERTDLALLQAYGVTVLGNAGSGTWPSVFLDTSTFTSDVNADLAVGDLDGDREAEFVLLAARDEPGVIVIDWDKTPASPTLPVALPSASGASLALGQVAGGDGLGVAVAGTGELQLVPNQNGALDPAGALLIAAGELHTPKQVLVIGSGADVRVIVPDSDEERLMGLADQGVYVYGPDGSAIGSLGPDFASPWALAEGDFLGDDAREIVVAERRLTDSNGSSMPGRLRFFSADTYDEIAAPLEVGVGTISLAAADLDCDGKTDLVIGNTGAPAGGSGVAGQGAPAQVLFGSCEAEPSREDLFEVPGGPIVAGWRLAAGDFDDDGLLEVAIPDAREPAPGKPGRALIVDVQEGT